MKSLLCVVITVLQLSKCEKLEGFVVGGHDTNIAGSPHSLFVSASCETSWICGAAILNQQVILTAAHCLFTCDIKRNHRIEVSAGSGNLKTVQIKRLVKKLEVHEFYSEAEVLNDIGLALLNQEIPLGPYTKRIIVQRSFPFHAPYAKVAGWGIVDEETQATSIVLKQVPQRLCSKVTCAKIGYLIQGMFCAGSENFYDDHPAAGDSGGALITNGHIAIGIVSFRVPQYPALSVYTNITFYYNWLTETTKNMFCNDKEQI